jgi:hypothetical protein
LWRSGEQSQSLFCRRSTGRGLQRSTKPDEATRAYYAAQYAQPGAMRAGFAQFTAFAQDAEDNKIFQQTKLSMPVLAIGGEKSFGATQAMVMRNVAIDVREAVAYSGRSPSVCSRKLFHN